MKSFALAGALLATIIITKPPTTFTISPNFGTTTPYFTEVDDGNSSTADTIDFSAGANHKSTVTGACTYTFTAPAGTTRVTLKLVHEASVTVYALTWPANVKWLGGAAIVNTNTSGAVDFVSCYYDTTNYYCVPSTNFF